MDQHCLRGNRPAHTTVAKPQALATQDPRDELSEKVQAQDKPPRSSHPHSLRSKNGKTSDKEARKEKKKQRRLDHERARKDSGTPATGVHAPNAASTPGGARKDLNQITCYNCNEKGHYSRNCSEPRRDASEEGELG